MWKRWGIAFCASSLFLTFPVLEWTEVTPGFASVLTFVFLSQYVAAGIIVLIDEFVIRRERHPRMSAFYWQVIAIAAIANGIKFATGRSIPIVLGLAAVLIAAALASGRARGWIRTVCSDVGALAVIGTIYWVISLHLPFADQKPPMPSASSAASGPTILIVFDELGLKPLTLGEPIDATLFPNFARMARDGLLTTNGTTNYTSSCSAMSSMFRGRFVEDRGEDRSHCREYLIGEASNLFEWIAPSHRVAIYEEYLKGCKHPGAALCRDLPFLAVNFPLNTIVVRLIPRGARVGFIGEAFPPTQGTYDRHMLAMLKSDLATFKSESVVYWAHFLVPHFPYVLNAQGALSAIGTTEFSDRGFDDASAYFRYREQVRYADTILGEVFGTLDSLGLTTSARLIVTGDHGPRYPMPNDPSDQTPLRDDTPRVPFFVVAPAVRGGVQSIEYQSIDFAPTVLGVLGLPERGGLDGVSIFAPNRPTRAKRVTTPTGRFMLDRASGQWLRTE